jgi:phage terminase large subunit-like protein
MPSLQAETLLGSPRPRLESRPESVGSHGDRVLKFSEMCGLTLDEWQAYVIGGLFDVTASGAWAASEFGLLVSRQNGKGEILVAYDLAHLFLFPRTDNRRKTILHTAHEVKTAIDGFQRLAGVIESVPKLMDRVENIYTANGQEGIVLKKRPGQLQGDRCRFIARTKKSGRGFAADVVVYDEAQQLSLQSSNALKYTQSQIDHPQGMFTGTVPEEGEDDSEIWEGLRDRGRRGDSPRTGWMEFTPAGSEDPDIAETIDLGDYEALIASNPSMGWRMPVESVLSQLESAKDVDPEGFKRERMSIWPNRRPAAAVKLSELDMARWNLNKVENVKLGDAPVIAIALGKGGGFATVAAASHFDDDSLVVEHMKTDRQTRWVAGYVKKLKEELGAALIVLDPKNAAVIINDLDREGVKYLPMNLNEIAAAHSMFIEYSNDAAIAHRGQVEVGMSLQFATTRGIGQAGLTWDPSDPTKPISHAQAVTWAAWGVKKAEANPAKKPAAVQGYA